MRNTRLRFANRCNTQMAGIEDPNVIDLITIAPSGEYAMIMVATSAWTDTIEQLSELLQKINQYLDFVTAGELSTKYPDSVGRPLRFQLDCMYSPTEAVEQVIRHAEKTLDTLNIRFVVQLLT